MFHLTSKPDLLWLITPPVGIFLAIRVLLDVRRSRRVVAQQDDHRLTYLAKTYVTRERRRIASQLLLFSAFVVTVFFVDLPTWLRIDIRNAAMTIVSAVIAWQSVSDLKIRRYLTSILLPQARRDAERELAS